MTTPLTLGDLGLPSFAARDAEASLLAATCLTQPQKLDLCAYRGDSGRFRVTMTEANGTTPIDISGATWDADIRLTVDDTALAGSFTVEPVVGTTNAVDVILTAAVSASLAAATYVWDLEMTLAGEVTTLLAGTIVVTKDVSRAAS